MGENKKIKTLTPLKMTRKNFGKFVNVASFMNMIRMRIVTIMITHLKKRIIIAKEKWPLSR